MCGANNAADSLSEICFQSLFDMFSIIFLMFVNKKRIENLRSHEILFLRNNFYFSEMKKSLVLIVVMTLNFPFEKIELRIYMLQY